MANTQLTLFEYLQLINPQKNIKICLVSIENHTRRKQNIIYRIFEKRSCIDDSSDFRPLVACLEVESLEKLEKRRIVLRMETASLLGSPSSVLLLETNSNARDLSSLGVRGTYRSV